MSLSPPLPKPVYVDANASALQAQAERSKAPVHVVYLWVNGSDPALHQELQQLQSGSKPQPQKAGRGLEDPAKQSRFDAGRDELRYSIRSVEMYLPWINHIFIVTNGQVRRSPWCLRADMASSFQQGYIRSEDSSRPFEPITGRVQLGAAIVNWGCASG